MEHVKLLGVFITSNLSWSMQVDYVLRAVSQKFYLIKQIRSMSLNMVSMNQIYNALVLSRWGIMVSFSRWTRIESMHS